MTDTKWRSPTGHNIASDVTDKLPPKADDFLTRGTDDVKAALDAIITRHNDTPLTMSEWTTLKSVQRALSQQQPDAELLEALKKQEYHNMKVEAFLEQEEDDNLKKSAEQKGGE